MADTVRKYFPGMACIDCGRVGHVGFEHHGPLVPAGQVGYFDKRCYKARMTDERLGRPVRPLGQAPETVLCPKCGKPAVSQGAQSVRVNGGESTLKEIFACPNGCQMDVDYSGDNSGLWPCEFFVENGETIFAGPSADWFA